MLDINWLYQISFDNMFLCQQLWTSSIYPMYCIYFKPFSIRFDLYIYMYIGSASEETQFLKPGLRATIRTIKHGTSTTAGANLIWWVSQLCAPFQSQTLLGRKSFSQTAHFSTFVVHIPKSSKLGTKRSRASRRHWLSSSTKAAGTWLWKETISHGSPGKFFYVLERPKSPKSRLLDTPNIVPKQPTSGDWWAKFRPYGCWTHGSAVKTCKHSALVERFRSKPYNFESVPKLDPIEIPWHSPCLFQQMLVLIRPWFQNVSYSPSIIPNQDFCDDGHPT